MICRVRSSRKLVCAVQAVSRVRGFGLSATVALRSGERRVRSLGDRVEESKRSGGDVVGKKKCKGHCDKFRTKLADKVE